MKKEGTYMTEKQKKDKAREAIQRCREIHVNDLKFHNSGLCKTFAQL